MTPLFKKKCELRPFQAADLVAWESQKFMKIAQGPLEEYDEGPRRSFLALESSPRDWGYLLREDIIATCKNFQVPRR